MVRQVVHVPYPQSKSPDLLFVLILTGLLGYLIYLLTYYWNSEEPAPWDQLIKNYSCPCKKFCLELPDASTGVVTLKGNDCKKKAWYRAEFSGAAATVDTFSSGTITAETFTLPLPATRAAGNLNVFLEVFFEGECCSVTAQQSYTVSATAKG